MQVDFLSAPGYISAASGDLFYNLEIEYDIYTSTENYHIKLCVNETTH